MVERTHIGAADDKGTLSPRVDTSLSKLKDPTAFAAMAAGARQELIRETLVLLLQVAKRVLKRGT